MALHVFELQSVNPQIINTRHRPTQCSSYHSKSSQTLPLPTHHLHSRAEYREKERYRSPTHKQQDDNPKSAHRASTTASFPKTWPTPLGRGVRACRTIRPLRLGGIIEECPGFFSMWHEVKRCDANRIEAQRRIRCGCRAIKTIITHR